MYEAQVASGRDALNPETLKKDFPILQQTVHDGKRLAYLDSAATTQKPSVVIDAVKNYYETSNSNVHRALHELASRATEGYESVRTKVAEFIGAESGATIVYTRGTTESINLVAHGWGRKFVTEGDTILISEMEHHSNMIPWQLLVKEKGATLKYIPVNEDGTLDLAAYEALLAEGVKLVSVTHMSNVLGTINPVKQMAASAHRHGAAILVDAAQSVPHMSVDVQDLDVDFYAFSGHKMCAPTGIGVLYGKPAILESMDPFMGGGEMILKVQWQDATWADPPHRFEPGTPNIAGVFGLGAALEYLSKIGMDNIHEYEQMLTCYAMTALEQQVPGLRIFGKAPERGGAIAFEMAGVHPHDIAQFVDRAGVAIRAGHHCAQPLMRKLGVPATSRASLYFYNTEEDIHQLIEALNATRKFFGV